MEINANQFNQTQPSPQKSQKLSLLGIGLFETGFVVLLLCIVFGILNYFNILSLSKAIPFLSFLPHRQVPFSALSISPTPPPPTTKDTLLSFVKKELNQTYWPDNTATAGAVVTKDQEFFAWTKKDNTAGLVRFIIGNSKDIPDMKRLSLQTPTASGSALTNTSIQQVAHQLLQETSNHTWICSNNSCTFLTVTTTQKKSVRIFLNADGSVYNLSDCVVDSISPLFSKFTSCP